MYDMLFQTYIEIDWDPNSTEEYTCDGDIIIPVSQLYSIPLRAVLDWQLQ